MATMTSANNGSNDSNRIGMKTLTNDGRTMGQWITINKKSAIDNVSETGG